MPVQQGNGIGACKAGKLPGNAVNEFYTIIDPATAE